MGDTGQPSPRGLGSSAVPVAAAAAVVLFLIVITVLLNSGGGSGGFDLRTSATIPSGHATDAVIADGDTVTGTGEVLPAAGGTARLCAPAGLTVGSHCRLWVRLTGVEPGRLGADRRATVTGVYRHGSIAVARMSPAGDSRPAGPGHEVVPCVAPDNGWPDGTVDLGAANRYRQAHPGTVVLVARLRPAKAAEVVYVVTSGDPSAAGTALTKSYGNRLCVVQSRFTSSQIATAEQTLVSRRGGGLTDVNLVGGPTIGAHGAVEVDATVPIVDESLAKAVDAQPAGLIQLAVWLRPTG